MSDITANRTEREHIQIVERLISNLQYGSVTLIVQDGKVVQIEKNEKVRLKG